MISVDDALGRILAPLTPMPAEQVGISGALGRVLAADVAARTTQPPVAVSAMDGYAVRAADVANVPARLEIVGEVPAGQTYDGEVSIATAVRIFTGAPVPSGADAIVIQEDTTRDGNRVVVRERAEAGTYIRPTGLDFSEGDVLLKENHLMTARDVGLAAAMNVSWLAVRRKPRVAILATGDEVVLPGDPMGPARVVSSNNFSLAALVEAAGGVAITLGIAADDPASLSAMASGAAGADFLVTTGGASTGDHDLVQSVLSEHGLKVDFWRIAMRPGKPLMFGHFGDVPMLGLPGNPVSTVVCGILFLVPAIERMLGLARPAEPKRTAILGCDVDANDRRQDYLRATLSYGADGDAIATPFPIQDSSMFARMAEASCLVVRAPHAPPAPAGTRVEIIPLKGGSVGI
ncbi:MAG: gephyrin-like molybdotransferase Glp [Alphaproteobacteria bacterium]